MGKRIMLVDDSATARMIIRRCLEAAGYRDAEYIEAVNGIDALGKLKNTRVDVILTDLNMPVMDGEHFLRHVKNSRRYGGIPVVVISSKTGAGNEDRLLGEGAAAVLNKPVTPMVVADVIESLDTRKERSG